MSALGVASPVGALRLSAKDGVVTSLTWEAGPAETDDPILLAAADDLARYFETGRLAVSVPLATGSGLTGRVCAALRAIPDAETRTYGDLARDLGVSAQAIGQACGANPIPILIPCHRVLGAAGLGGYSGAGGIETKVALLRLERAAGLLI